MGLMKVLCRLPGQKKKREFLKNAVEVVNQSQSKRRSEFRCTLTNSNSIHCGRAYN